MAEPEKSEKPKSEDRPESPTTAKALDFDDDVADTPVSPPKAEPENAPKPKPSAEEEAAPPKPPRPVGPEQQAENTLKEAFPTIDPSVIRAVLRASGGQLEPAFNALLGMSDPDAAEPAPPPQPPRPAAAPTSTDAGQLAADERYARQLAEHYNSTAPYQGNPRSGPGGGQPQGRPVQQGRYPTEEERERSFIDDDLPIIRDNIRKGFLETQSTVNKWVNNLKKKIDGEDDDEFQSQPAPPAQGYVPQRQYGGRGSGEYGRRSTDRDRYDADPQVLGDDFAGLELRDNDAPRRTGRPLANPDLFKPTPPRPQSGSGRRVSFQDGPPEEIDIHYPKSPSPSGKPSAGSGQKSSKWQPLASVDPNPVGENDPFSLGDSDDDEAKKKDQKAEEGERLKQAAAEAMSEDIGDKEPTKKEDQGTAAGTQPGSKT